MAYRFVGPSIKETPVAWNRLHMRYGLHRGITVMRVNGIYSTYRYPAQTEIAAAQEVYMGGHEYFLTEKQKDDLTAAGFGQYITVV